MGNGDFQDGKQSKWMQLVYPREGNDFIPITGVNKIEFNKSIQVGCAVGQVPTTE